MCKLNCKSYFFFLALLLFISPSCDKISDRLDTFTQFEMDLDQTITIPASSKAQLPFNITTPDIETDSESSFAVNNSRKDLVEEVTLTKLQLTLSSPENGDFGFLKSIAVYVGAGDLPEVKIAWKDSISEDAGKILELEVTGVDLQEYIKKEAINLRVNTVTDELLTSDHVIDLHTVFYVDVKVLGN